jgi:hypothetical protein
LRCSQRLTRFCVPGNVLAEMVQMALLDLTLIGGQYFCDGTAACDYSLGGVRTTQTVRNVLFEGYIDMLAMKARAVHLVVVRVSSLHHSHLRRCSTRSSQAAT